MSCRDMQGFVFVVSWTSRCAQISSTNPEAIPIICLGSAVLPVYFANIVFSTLHFYTDFRCRFLCSWESLISAAWLTAPSACSLIFVCLFSWFGFGFPCWNLKWKVKLLFLLIAKCTCGELSTSSWNSHRGGRTCRRFSCLPRRPLKSHCTEAQLS